MAPAALEEHLATLGTVDAVGQAFTVFKVSGLEGVSGNVDVSIPRRDSKVGPGHRGIAVTGDPDLSIEEASRRRDFTINAMLWDPRDGVLHDPHGGRGDLEARRLRCVDPESFAEDPLRALRAIQLAARFELTVDEETASLCAGMPLAELPPERIFGEIEKLLLKAQRPSIGLALLHDWNLLPVVAPELVPLKQTEQEPDWHPEGDVWIHTLLAMDEAALLIDDLDRPRALAVMLGTLCHDLGKPATTRFEEGRIRSRGHEEAGVPPTLSLLDRFKVFHAARLRPAGAGRRAGAPSPQARPALRRARTRGRRRNSASRAQVRAAAPLPCRACRLPREEPGRLPARGDGVVPRASPRPRGHGAPP